MAVPLFYKELTQQANIVTTSNSDSKSVADAHSLSHQVTCTVNTPSNKNFLGGVVEVNTVTFETLANSDDGDFAVVTDTAGLEWAVALDKTGSSAEPTASEWTSIPAGRKGQADVSGDTTAADVAASAETAFNALSGFSSVVTTDDTAADGTMTFTQSARGAVANIATYQEDGTASDISVAETTPGVDSAVDVSNENITISSHGLTTGLKVQASSTGTLPAGLSTSTDYFVIAVDDNTVRLATSLENALAGTAINLTDQGTAAATHTLEVTALAGGSIQLQGSNDDSTWVNIGSAVNITATATNLLADTDVEYGFTRVQSTLTAGRMTVDIKTLIKKSHR